MPKERLTEERTPKGTWNYFPQPQHRNKFCDKYLVDVIVHQKKQNLALKFLDTNSPWISKYLRITCPDAVSASATNDVTCPDAASSSSAALSTADPYVTSSFSASDSTISRCSSTCLTATINPTTTGIGHVYSYCTTADTTHDADTCPDAEYSFVRNATLIFTRSLRCVSFKIPNASEWKFCIWNWERMSRTMA